MENFRALKVIDKFRRFFERLGVDYEIMRKILQVKLTLDGRRVPTIMNSSSMKKEGNNFVKSLWMYLIISAIMLPFILFGKNYLFQMSIVFGISMFMIMTSMVSDFSSVLLDIRDKNIILTKPVNSKTLSIAKIVHILIYMFYITAAICGIPLIAGLFKHGIVFFLVFLIEIILMDLFIVVLTALIYLLILKFYDGEKLKDIINYVQIVLTIAITIGYQLIGRLFDFADIGKMVFSPKWWQYFIAPIWFSAPFEFFINGMKNFYIITFSILAIIIPIISIFIYVKLVPSFEKNLQKLNNNNSNDKVKNKRLSYFISTLICKGKKERTFYRFTADMIKSERVFKLRVYPSLGFSIIFPFIFLFNNVKNGGWNSIPSSKLYLYIYFIAILVPTIITTMGYSGSYKGAWVYRIVPLDDTTPIFKGSLKAILVRLILPMYIIDSIIFMIIFKGKIIIDLIVVFLNIMLFTIICFKISKKSLPFSNAFNSAQNKGEGLIFLPMFVILGILVLIHYFSTKSVYGIYIYMMILIIVNIISWRSVFNVPFKELND